MRLGFPEETDIIRQFGPETALLLIDVQKGVNLFEHWGGPTGRRNNPQAEQNMKSLLSCFRARGLRVIFSQHDSREAASPLKLSLPSGAMIEGFEPASADIVVRKDVNSVFIGTDLELRLREHAIGRLVIAGFFTNFCVDSSTRMAGNLGYDTYLAQDACATCNRIGPNGEDYDPGLLHSISVANLHGEFCTAVDSAQVVALTESDNPELERVQGNE